MLNGRQVSFIVCREGQTGLRLIYIKTQQALKNMPLELLLRSLGDIPRHGFGLAQPHPL
jgi:hypothetical protein